MRYTRSLLIRVILAIALLLIPLLTQKNIFQIMFEYLTLHSTFFLLRLANVDATLGSYSVKHAIDISGEITVNIVKYCVTASAYYLYTLFVILVFDVSIWKRIRLLILGYVAIFAMNIARILILIVMLFERGPETFVAAHDFLGTALAIFYVLIIWILFSLAMEIKTIPIITDIKILIGEIMQKDEV
jgi:exosortase/archaeosortase family protein